MSYKAYVDGSGKLGLLYAGYGLVILDDQEQIYEECGRVPSQSLQVAGEIEAVKRAIHWCLAQKVFQVEIYYDYEGLFNWPSGAWRAKKTLTRNYARFMNECGVHVTWIKVTAHQGDTWNERADKLAKHGLFQG